MHESIRVAGARVHNLKNVSLDIPRDEIVVFTGVSGSGKSSLVFDTLHTEARRQLIETFSSFARRRLPKLSRPDVDAIMNLSTSIVIDQKRMGTTLRSTVGTATETYDYLKMLWSRCGDLPGVPSFFFGFNNPTGMCPACKGLGKRIRVNVDAMLDRDLTLREGAIVHPEWKVGGWNWREITGGDLFDVDKPLREFSAEEMERLLYVEALPITRTHGGGTYAKTWKGIVRKLEDYYVDKGEDELPAARRDAYQRVLVYGECDVCGGVRVNERARSVKVQGLTIGEAVSMELTDLDSWLAGVSGPLAEPLVRKMRRILGHLTEIGVGYLSLNRAVATLSGGESQRVKMARQLDCDLVGMMYVMDEPSIGLHPRDVEKLVGMLRSLRDRGNSVLVVEHDTTVIGSADHVVEIGPVAGCDGGHVVFAGSAEEFAASDCLTARIIRDGHVRGRARRGWTEAWPVRNARAHNLKGVDVDIPMGALVAVTGVAGSGKSSLIHDVFVAEHPETVVVDQGAIARSSRSNPATFLGMFDDIRKLFAKATGKPASLFSFNSKGACPECNGAGTTAVDMHFLDDVKMLCPKCEGRRYTDEVLGLKWNGRGIHEVLSLTAREAAEVFRCEKKLRAQLELLCDIGLDYLAIGQSLSTLSGGECQRLKLATELGKSGNLYVLDEPTTGLHLADIERLVGILDRLVDGGNSVVVIEHSLEVIAQADWVIDLGPEGGKAGGMLVAQGTPEQIAEAESSHTGRALRAVLDAGAVRTAS